MCKNVFSERPQAVKCPNFLASHIVFLKSCEIFTEAIETPCANTFGGGAGQKPLDLFTVICILQFSLISEYFSKVEAVVPKVLSNTSCESPEKRSRTVVMKCFDKIF